jgi:hypothetical protein
MLLAEIPGVARNYIRNEGTREINYGLIYKVYNLQRFFTPGERATRTHWIKGWVGPKNRSGRCGEEKHLAPAVNPTPAVQTVARRNTTDTGVIRIPVLSQLHAPTVLPRGE